MTDPDFHASSSRGKAHSLSGFAVILNKQGNQVENVALTGGTEGLLARLRELGDSLHA